MQGIVVTRLACGAGCWETPSSRHALLGPGPGTANAFTDVAHGVAGSAPQLVHLGFGCSVPHCVVNSGLDPRLILLCIWTPWFLILILTRTMNTDIALN